MLTTEQYLNLINQRGIAGQPLKRVYGNMVKQTDLFINAYGKLYANRGAMTPGVDGNTVDGFSLKKVEGLIQELKERTFRWTPIRRTYIPKGDGKQRPLGIATWKDKVVQEVIRVILEAYYEPQFSKMSHGFRPNRSCHTALGEIKNWRGTSWFIEGDIKGCFDNISHTKLSQILGRHIKDSSFLRLINGMLKAGYLEDWKYHQTYSGAPQGNIASPILANIFLNELDQAVEELLPRYNRGKERKINLEYGRIQARIQRARKKGNQAEVRKLIEQRKRTPTRVAHDPNYRRLKYARYADDFLLGFIGPKVEAVEIKQAIGEILTGLELEMNDHKTFITHAQTQSARFLGFEINRQVNLERRNTASDLYFKVPWDVIVKWRRRYTKAGKAYQRHNLIDNSDYEIIQNYQLELQGLYQYYQNAHNVGKAVNKIRWYMLQSLVKTLARKHRAKVTTIYKRYKTRGQYRKDCISITQDGKTATFGDISIHRKYIWGKGVNDAVPMGWVYYGRNEIVRRLNAGKCEIPGCDYVGHVEGHHIRALKDLEQKYGKTKERPRWVEVMLSKRRKSLMVCPEHHKMIHAGEYDGPKLTNLATS